MERTIAAIKKRPTLKNFIMRMILLFFGSTLTIFSFNSEWKEHLILRIIFFVFILLMGIEIHMLLPKNRRPRLFISICATLLFPTFLLLDAYLPFRLPIGPLHLIVLFFLFHSLSILSNRWENILSKAQSTIFILIYPGLLASFFLHLSYFDQVTSHFYLLIGLSFIVDGFAYLTGFSLGRIEKKRRKTPLLSVSPSKTITGYIGGTIFGYLYAVHMYYRHPEIFGYSLLKTWIFVTCVTIAIILGDLFESALKRELHVKDSGKLMLGRGGVLDTFDSLLFAAPVYVILYQLMF